mmetsp:Transcript_2496/g.6647  ORF Transcript_2496/g.6647 Transcript_2496/m.6647 type:complete len:299 (-) Transcript_2496:3860-4756(-)
MDRPQQPLVRQHPESPGHIGRARYVAAGHGHCKAPAQAQTRQASQEQQVPDPQKERTKAETKTENLSGFDEAGGGHEQRGRGRDIRERGRSRGTSEEKASPQVPQKKGCENFTIRQASTGRKQCFQQPRGRGEGRRGRGGRKRRREGNRNGGTERSRSVSGIRIVLPDNGVLGSAQSALRKDWIKGSNFRRQARRLEGGTNHSLRPLHTQAQDQIRRQTEIRGQGRRRQLRLVVFANGRGGTDLDPTGMGTRQGVCLVAGHGGGIGHSSHPRGIHQCRILWIGRGGNPSRPSRVLATL